MSIEKLSVKDLFKLLLLW